MQALLHLMESVSWDCRQFPLLNVSLPQQGLGCFHQAVPHVRRLHREEPRLRTDAVQELQAHVLLVLSAEPGCESVWALTSSMLCSQTRWRTRFTCRATSSWDTTIKGRAETSWATPGLLWCGTERRWAQPAGPQICGENVFKLLSFQQDQLVINYSWANTEFRVLLLCPT